MSSVKHSGPERARVILQHGLEWMKTMKLDNGSRAAVMRDRLIDMASQTDQREFEYSLRG